MTNADALQILAAAAGAGIQAAFDHIQAQLPKSSAVNGAPGEPKAKRRRGKKAEVETVERK